MLLPAYTEAILIADISRYLQISARVSNRLVSREAFEMWEASLKFLTVLV